MEKKNKLFDDKYNALKNRIEILKREEQIYKNQLKNLKNKERKDNLIQFDKMKIKFELNKIKEEQNKELLKKKERIHNFKNRAKNKMEETRNENLSNKKRKYQSALNDKYLMKCIIEELNSQQLNKKCSQHEKIKQSYNEYETNKIKKNLIKENLQQLEYENNINILKNKEKIIQQKCNELENIEKKCLENLNKTKLNNIRYIENTSESLSKFTYGFNKIGTMRNLNRSMELDKYSKNKMNINTVLSPSIKIKIDKKDNITDYSNSSSKSIFTNTKNKNKINLKIKSDITGRNFNSLYDTKKAISQPSIKDSSHNKNKTQLYLKYNKINNNPIRINKKSDSCKNIMKGNKNTIKVLKMKK